MYKYFEDKEYLNKARRFCSEIMKELEADLREEKDINSQSSLVGSGGRNMVTINGNSNVIDFDYNLEIISCDCWGNLNSLKEKVKLSFDRVMSNRGLGYVNSSTSVLTSKEICFRDCQGPKFKIDVCIICKNEDGSWERLIQDKTCIYPRFYWNIAPRSKNYGKKVKYIKDEGYWNEVRAEYIELKNNYLKIQENNHPSFICYVEAVNNVYNWLKRNSFYLK